MRPKTTRVKMEPLLQAISVIEGVNEEICSALGKDAFKHIDPNRLFATAEIHVKNGLSIEAAKKEIIATVLPKTKKSLERSRSKRDVSEASTSGSIDSIQNSSDYEGTALDHRKLLSDDDSKGATKCSEILCNGNDLEGISSNKESNSFALAKCAEEKEVEEFSRKCHSFQNDIFVSDIEHSNDSEKCIINSTIKIGLKKCNEISSVSDLQKNDKAFKGRTNSKTSNPVDYDEFDKKETNCKFKLENNDIDNFLSVDSPSSPSFLPGLERSRNLGNSDSQRGTDSKTDWSSVGNISSPEISVLLPSPRPSPLIDLVDDSTCSNPPSCSSDIVVVGEVEKSVYTELDSCDINPLSSKIAKGTPNIEGKSNIPGVSSVVHTKDSASNNVEYTIDEAFDPAYAPDTDITVNKIENHSIDFKKHIGEVIDRSKSLENVGLGRRDLFENEKSTKQNGNSDILDNDSMNEENPDDKLWKDAQFVCSLLPYFQLADIHETMVDNFYHPDRKAHVLEAYIQLALDRDEMVPDNVFLILNTARKRSHTEACGNEAVNGKKQKVGHADFGEAAIQTAFNAVNTTLRVNNPVPSTSREVVPSAVFNAHSKADLSESVNDYVNVNEREKWIQEKLEFVCAVVCDIDKDQILARLKNCFGDSDVEALITTLLEDPPRPQAPSQQNVHRPLPEAYNQPNTSAFQAVDRGRTTELQVNEDNNAAVEGPSGEGEEAPNVTDSEDRIVAQINTLTEMFSDADPDYLRERVVGTNGKPEDFQSLVEELMEKKDYPKLEEYLKRQKRLEIKKKFIEGMSVEEFLEYFEDPEKVFCDAEKKMSATYMENARTQLLRDLPYHLSKDIDTELRKNNYHYLPTLRALEGNRKLSRRKTKRVAPPKESDLDDIFIKEQCYVRMQLEIKEYLLKKEENKRRAFLWAKASNQLQECGCCYDDEILEEDMDSCNSLDKKHKFCCNCIRRFAEEEIGQGRITFRCLQGECKAEFSLGTLKKLMKPSVFSNILARKQLEEIAAAGIEDLESCPFCNFQTIMPNKEDKVFKCLNPECMKDSCRLCKEPNHVPLRCEEVEKQQQKDARTFLENKMTEAMVRECWKCKKRFIKADGCNKMRCSCGAMMCYICKKAIKGYDHFEDNPVPINKNKCPLWSNSEKIHAEEVRDAAKKLKDELDPGIELKHDPTKDLPEVPKHLDQWSSRNIPGYIPPPAHQRRDQYVMPAYRAIFPPPLAHHHQRIPPQAHHHLPQVMPPNLIPLDPHQPPQPAHQHPAIPPIHLVINPGRNDFHHHHHHHYHHHVQHQANARQVGDDQRVLIDQLNEFNEVMRNVRHDHQQENLPPVVYQPNPLRFRQRVLQHLPPQNVQNLPQEPLDQFIQEI